MPNTIYWRKKKFKRNAHKKRRTCTRLRKRWMVRRRSKRTAWIVFFLSSRDRKHDIRKKNFSLSKNHMPQKKSISKPKWDPLRALRLLLSVWVRDEMERRERKNVEKSRSLCIFMLYAWVMWVCSCCCYKTSAASLFQVLWRPKLYFLPEKKDFMNFYIF